MVKLKADIDRLLEQHLPESLYPAIHRKRRVYAHIKKLTDVYVGETGYKLVLDSDMLFFKRPDVLISWLQQPSGYFHIWDTTSSYHYSLDLMKRLCGTEITDQINVGAIGLKGDGINWDKIEAWIVALEKEQGTSYYLEQALSAMIIGDKPVTTGSRQDYIVMPTPEQVAVTEGVLHHYVDISKEFYYKTAWRTILRQ